MPTYYITGYIELFVTRDAAERRWRGLGPHVVRQFTDGTWTVCKLTDKPVQPGQAPFKLLRNEQVLT